MNISESTFRAIVKSLRSDEAAATSREKRTSPRVGLRGRAKIAPRGCGPEQAAEVTVRNLSANGIGFLHLRAMLPGDQFLLLLPRGRAAGGSVLCTVVRCGAATERLYSIGAVFEREAAFGEN